jgi:nitroreductase
MNPVLEAIWSMRAVRSFKPDPVEDEKMRLVLEAATKAASGGNVQPWAFVVIRDREKKLEVQKLVSTEWHRMIDEDVAKMRGKKKLMYESAGVLVDNTADVPALILACLDLAKTGDGELKYASIYPSVQNMMLAAWSLGLGTCLTTHGCTTDGGEQTLKRILGIPDGVKAAAMIYLGYPAGALSPPRRRPLDVMVHHERW